MKISRSEFDKFDRAYARQPNKGERYGQAWYNHFRLHSHTPASIAERILLDTIYEIPDKSHARTEILNHFTDSEN